MQKHLTKEHVVTIHPNDVTESLANINIFNLKNIKLLNLNKVNKKPFFLTHILMITTKNQNKIIQVISISTCTGYSLITNTKLKQQNCIISNNINEKRKKNKHFMIYKVK